MRQGAVESNAGIDVRIRGQRWLPLFALLLAGGAPFAAAEQTGAASQWENLRADQEQLAARFALVIAQTQALSQNSGQAQIRLTQAEGPGTNRGVVQLLNQVDALNAELNKLRGKIEELGNSIANAEKRQKDMYLDLDTRLRRVEQQGGGGASRKTDESIAALAERVRKLEQGAAIPAPINTAAGSETPAPGTAIAVAPVPAAGAESPQRAYEVALASYRGGDFQGAINGFQNFLKQFPQHTLAVNAQYWIGDAYFQLRDYKSAIEAQKKLLSSYPDNPKASDALLNIGSSELGLGDTAAARKSWEELISRYPGTEAAIKAKQRLARLP